VDNSITLNQLFNSCSLLFPSNTSFSVEFLEYLKPEGLKRAYWDKVKENHPDKARHSGKSETELAVRFCAISEAYEMLAPFVNGDHSIRGLLNSKPSVFVAPKTKKAQPTPSNKGNKSNPPRFDMYHNGPIPAGRVRFCHFLYYHGLISWQNLLDALAWQRTNRPIIGRIAQEWGYLNGTQVNEVLRNLSIREPFGETAFKMGYLTRFQVMALVGRQLAIRLPVGRYFIEKGLLSEAELCEMVRRHQAHNLTPSFR